MQRIGGRSSERTGDAGMTLVESLMSIVLLGVAATGIILGWTTVVANSNQHVRQSQVSSLSASAANAVQDPNRYPYDAAGCGATYDLSNEATRGFAVPDGYAVSARVEAIWSASDNDFAPCIPESPAESGLQLVEVSATTTDGAALRTVSVVKRQG